MIILELPVKWHSDETTKLDGLGIKYDRSKLTTKQVYFTNINGFYSDSDGDTVILANGSTFITPLSVEELFKAIDSI